jgi:hypothetical protein
MNKKLQNLLLEKFSIISVIILVLVYIYISIPNDILAQKGGATTFKMPPNVPMLYKYRFVFVALPFLLVGLIAFYAYYYYVTLPSVTFWDLGSGFFSSFQKQFSKLVSTSKAYKDRQLPNYKSGTPDGADNDMSKFFNIIRYAGDPLGGLNLPATYFCSVARPCGCCNDNDYLKYFFECNDKDDCKNNEKYNKKCFPNNAPRSSPSRS